jgi:3-oxoacyl-[acyl-carrier protein] reductase
VSDWYRDFANSGVGTTLVKQLGLPRPAVLRRYTPGQPLLDGPALVGSAGEGRLRAEIEAVLRDDGVTVLSPATADGGSGPKVAAVVLDATGLTTPADLASAHDFLAPAVKGLGTNGRVVVLGEVPGDAPSPSLAAARQALDGLVRSLAKELRAGATANLVYVPSGAEAAVPGPLRFFLSGRSAYVDGQTVTLSAVDAPSGDAGTARTWSPWTSRPPARRWPRSPTGSAGRRCSWTSPPRMPPSDWWSTWCSGTAGPTSSCTTPASPGTSCWSTWTPRAGTRCSR